MKTIIAPTDFSPYSINAVNYAADMASAMNASLSLLFVCQLPMAFSEVPVTAENINALVEDGEKKIAELKKTIHQRYGEDLKIYTEIRTGLVVGEISAYCDATHPYAVVMATQGAGAMQRFFFGSNTISAMKNLSCPLIVVPADAHFTSIKKIGLACDLKKVVETAPVNEIKAIVKEFGAQLYVLHVNTEGEHQYGPEIIEQSGLLQQMLEEMHPSYHFLNGNDVDQGLIDFTEKNKLDLLIVVPKKHNLIGKLFHKSHTKTVVLHTHIPVMAIHE